MTVSNNILYLSQSHTVCCISQSLFLFFFLFFSVTTPLLFFIFIRLTPLPHLFLEVIVMYEYLLCPCLQMCFEYVAEQLDAVESFWTFVTENPSLSIPFQCVGTAREPLTYLGRPHLAFGELLVGKYSWAPHTHTDIINLNLILCRDQCALLVFSYFTFIGYVYFEEWFYWTLSYFELCSCACEGQKVE